MTIITDNQQVKAALCMNAGLLSIDFEDEPSFIRSEAVLIDLMQRSIGIIFQNSYHHIGSLPADIIDVERMTRVRLSGHGEGGKEIVLHAPIRLRKM